MSKQQQKTAVALASAKTVAAVERLARADRRLAATVDQWDADPWLLNTPTGIVDLRTGKLGPHRADAFMTKITGVGPDASCPIATWLKFLDRVMNGDAELVAFLQRMFGYCLTGLVQEHALFFCYGTGSNGKSVFLNVLIACLGDYHRVAPVEIFQATPGSARHPTELAGLRGARLVSATETEENRSWAEAKIKWLTGGDVITARFMRADFFDYRPQFKPIVAGNHRPSLRTVDEAIRRRMYLIPFVVTIPIEERDPQLGEKLKAEWAGILAWAIKGCVDWQARGLTPPAAVRSATDSYLEAEDARAAWLRQHYDFDGSSWSGSTMLYLSWKAFADRAGEFAGSEKKLSQYLIDRAEALGIRKQPGPNNLAGFVGLRLKKPPEAGSGGETGSGGAEIEI